MGSPTIFSGTFCKLLNSAGILKKNGHILNYDGKRNYIANNHAEVNTTGWSTYADAAGSVPVDGTGGAPTTTWTRSTSSPLSGSGSFLLTKDAANRQGEGVSYAFTIDNADKSRQMRIACDLEGSAAFVVGDSSDVRIFIYDVTNAVLIYPNRYTINTATGKFEAQWDSSSSTSYRLVFHIATTNASAWTLKVDNVICGITEPVFGAAVSNWQAYTLNIGSTAGSSPTKGTIVRDEAKWRRVGDSMEIEYNYSQSAVGSDVGVTGHYLWPLPSGYLIDTTKLGLALAEQSVSSQCGVFKSSYAGTTIDHTGIVKAYDTGNLIVNIGSSYVGKQNNHFHISSNASLQYSFFARVPIIGWSSNVTLSNSSTFKLSSILANGTRVTTTPSALGEYRTLIKASAARTYTDDAPTAAPSAANGMRIFSVDGTAAGTSGNTNRWVFFVGKNKTVRPMFYSSTGLTGRIDTNYSYDASAEYGLLHHYDQTTGLCVITLPVIFPSTARNVGFTMASDTGSTGGVSDCYFDIIVSENALAVGIDAPTMWSALTGLTYNGFGTVTNESVWHRRIGDTWYVRGYVNCGTTTATAAYIGFPTGYTIDTSKFGALTDKQKIGMAIKQTNATTNIDNTNVFVLYYDGASSVRAYITDQVSSNSYLDINTSTSLSSGQGFDFSFEVPILGW